MPATLGMIGFGAFGAFAARALCGSFNILAHDPAIDAAASRSPDVRMGSLHEAAACDFVVLAVPAQEMDDLCLRLAPLLRPGALVMDVCSVKVRPLEIMRARLPESVEIIGTHPLFGPQSGRESIAGLSIVLCPVRATAQRLGYLRGFLTAKLGLNVLESDPIEHDRAMAHVQALTHYVARALGAIGLPDSPMSTRAYAHLRAIAELLGSDSWALFESIQNENPFASELRERFRAELDTLDDRLSPRM